jgi:hypothetical protein
MHNVFERMPVRDFGLTNSRTWRVQRQALNKAIAIGGGDVGVSREAGFSACIGGELLYHRAPRRRQ